MKNTLCIPKVSIKGRINKKTSSFNKVACAGECLKIIIPAIRSIDHKKSL